MASEKVIAQSGQYLTFMLSDQVYGLPISTVREINRVAEITQVPQTPDFMAGVMNLRGLVIPVVNLRLKLGLPTIEHTRQTCVIVIEGEAGLTGMIVDSVRGVIDLSKEQIEPAPVLGPEKNLAFLMGLGKTEGEVVLLVDILKTLSVEELQSLSAAA